MPYMENSGHDDSMSAVKTIGIVFAYFTLFGVSSRQSKPGTSGKSRFLFNFAHFLEFSGQIFTEFLLFKLF